MSSKVEDLDLQKWRRLAGQLVAFSIAFCARSKTAVPGHGLKEYQSPPFPHRDTADQETAMQSLAPIHKLEFETAAEHLTVHFGKVF